MPHQRRSPLVHIPLVAVAVVVLSAGACQQDWEGPLPPPDELGAEPLPDPAGGIDAVYAALTGPGAGEEQCYRVLTFTPDGAMTRSSICTSEPVGEVLDRLGEPIAEGDYSYRDGSVRARLVQWDWLAEELTLDEYDATVCGTEYRAGSTFEIVAGDPPSGAPPCPTP